MHGAPAVADPYADVTLGKLPGCTLQPVTTDNNATINLKPGEFCSGWNFGNNVTVTLEAGTYYIDSQFILGNSVTVNATAGVTLILNDSYGSFAIQTGNSTKDVLNIKAQTSGLFAGMAIVDLSTDKTVTQTFSNNMTMTVTGALYFRNQTLVLANNGMTTTGGCIQVIADKLLIKNNAELDNNCAGTGVLPFGSSPSVLVE